jgi:hypothetical protein
VLFGFGQSLSSYRCKKIMIDQRQIKIDSLSIVPNSLRIVSNKIVVDTSNYSFGAENQIIFWKYSFPIDTMEICYSVYPINFTKTYFNKSKELIMPEGSTINRQYIYNPVDNNLGIFEKDGLTKSGSISRGIGFGNAQDLTVNSNFNLSLAGPLNDKINILASVTDNNIPIQPEGNTAQLQDFDQVFIQIYDAKSKLIVGDFTIARPTGYFLNFNKRGQGASFETLYKSNNVTLTDSSKYLQIGSRASVAISKGKFARQIIQGIESNQGPYKLSGTENETFIIVLSGTENIYIDGKLMKRGLENDYVIDYNNAEITFTSKQLITKDKRITAEFQYSDKNYARSLVETSNTFSKNKIKGWLNIYAEQDAKNQPLQQELTNADKVILNNAGDNIFDAITPGFDVVNFSNEQVLYKLIDTLGFDSVFVYSTQPDSAKYQLVFSDLGFGNGNYQQAGFTANGRLFKWIAPDTIAGEIIKNGNFEPVRLLITPKKKQMISTGLLFSPSKNTSLNAEIALSNNDINTFSNTGDANNQGYAAKFIAENSFGLQNDSLEAWRLKSIVKYEFTSKHFSAIERFREVEFDRNWNLTNLPIDQNDQHILSSGFSILKSTRYNFGYFLDSFLNGENYKGLKNNFASDVKLKTFSLKTSESILISKGIVKTKFIKHRSDVKKNLKAISVGFADELEENTFFKNNSDTLLNTSYRFYDWQFYISNPDSTKNNYKLYYRQRNDGGILNNSLSSTTNAQEYGLDFGFIENSKHTFKGRFSNRQLKIINSDITVVMPENTIVGRVEHTLRIWKNILFSNIFYENTTGLERQQEFVYVSDPSGQGIYAWRDYNNNNIQELNEFEVARPEDGNRFIKFFTPTNIYVKAFNNQYSQSVSINPGAAFNNKKGLLKFVSLFTNETAYSVERKTNKENGIGRFNPFVSEIPESELLSAASNFRNSSSFNRSSSVFGTDFIYTELANKNLLTVGFDTRKNISRKLAIRWNLTPKWSLNNEFESAKKNSSTDYITGRDFSIKIFSFKPIFSFQPNTNMRISLNGSYTEKYNDFLLGNETAVIRNIGSEFRLNQANSGSFLANFNLISISYSAGAINTLAYEMLDGLNKGQNFTWSASVQRNLSKNLQLNLIYNARKSESVKAIHNGNVQLRAFF